MFSCSPFLCPRPVFVVLDVVVGELGVGSGNAAPSDATAERVELETVAKNIESTTGGAQEVGEGSLDVM